jgi:ATPase subunit of ABC transporter with duplicated ATPase domains
MLTVHYLSKSFDLQPLFENVSFSLAPGEHTGLIGPNGCGKTTLMRILAAVEQPDSGHISRALTFGSVTCRRVSNLTPP